MTDAINPRSADWDDDDDDWEMTDEDLEYFKNKLLELRADVQRRLSRNISEAVNDSEAHPDEFDEATKLSEQAYLMRLSDKNRKLLRQIEHALSKFDEGEYGYCEGTGDLISRKRLELRPWTRYSIAYKEELERTGRR
ncbi:MAG: TraR/DksA C4-type zinc finger protein [Myxococcota bacterium]